jgi:peptidylprolyl isomerase
MKKLLFLLLASISLFAANPVALIQTNQGDIEIELRPDAAPKACENFIALTKKGYYNGLIFHRVIKGFMIQGGDPTGTGRGGQSVWGKDFADEITPKITFDKPYLLAMANRGPGTNGSQFFITVAQTPWLNGHHTIFGEVKSGLAVLKKIEFTQADTNDRPKAEQKILKIIIK